MLHYFFSVSRSGAEACHGILVEQLGANVLGIFAQEWKIKLGLAVLNVPEQLLLILAVEGRLAAQHLIDDASEGPPVRSLAVALVEEDLRRQVLGRSADTLRVIVPLNVLL